jgi:TonB family protein
MKVGFGLISLGLALFLGGSATFSPSVSAQNSAEESVKRKVRTRVSPEYPPLAKQMHISGKVKIETTISAEGRVTNTRVIGGSPLLASAALKALNEYRFEPGPKETTEIIEFEFNDPN